MDSYRAGTSFPGAALLMCALETVHFQAYEQESSSTCVMSREPHDIAHAVWECTVCAPPALGGCEQRGALLQRGPVLRQKRIHTSYAFRVPGCLGLPKGCARTCSWGA